MDDIVSFLHNAVLLCSPVFILAIIAKIILVLKRKGFNLPAIIISFFKIYKRWEKQKAKTPGKKNFMVWSNRINYFLYSYTLLFIVMLLIYMDDIFEFSSY